MTVTLIRDTLPFKIRLRETCNQMGLSCKMSHMFSFPVLKSVVLLESLGSDGYQY